MNIAPVANVAIGIDNDGDIFVELAGACGCCGMRGFLSPGQADAVLASLRFQIDAARARKRGAMAAGDGGRA